jgi:hypothetical protein
MKHKATLQFAIFLVIATSAYATVLYVPADYPDIRSAVGAASDGDEIVLTDGIYSGENNRNIYITDSITIRSANGPDNCIIDCNGPEQQERFAFDMRAPVVLEGLSIVNGKRNYGGAICCLGELTAINCVFVNNSALYDGGVIELQDGKRLTLMNCRLTGNTAGETGGAVFCEGDNNLMVMNSEFVNNSAIEGWSEGGAIASASKCRVTLINSKLEGNSAGEYGGAIYCNGSDGSLVINKCSISDNRLNGGIAAGAGICIDGGYKLDIGDTVIARNSAISSESSSAGGGLYLRDADGSKIKNCQITDNIVGTEGAGGGSSAAHIFCEGAGLAVGESSNVIFVDCIISGNRVVAPSSTSFQLWGGGLYCGTGAKPILLRCRIQNNIAQYGTAIFCSKTSAIVVNCLISGNKRSQADEVGGCIVSRYSYDSFVLANSTIVGNDSYAILDIDGISQIKVHNCIIYYNNHNRRCDYGEQVSCFAEITYSCVQTHKPENPPWPGEGNINVDPCFVVPGYWNSNGTPDCEDDFWVEGDYHLKSDSNCIDSGGVPIWYIDTTDLDNLPRMSGAAIDMGVYEHHNTAPVAIAGPNQLAYACFNGLADVELDGSGSYDNDDDELAYKWSWTIDGNNCEANSVAPTINLPVGTHDIELIVHDGTGPSKPDHCVVEVIGGVEGKLMVMPRMISCRSRGWWITVILNLPAEVNPEDISEEPLKLYPDGINSVYQKLIRWYPGKGVSIFAVFEREAFCEAVEQSGLIEVNVAGELVTGRYFYGTSSMKIFQ